MRGRRASIAADGGQALPLAVGCVVVVLLVGFGVAAIGAGAVAKGRAQRAADLVALSSATVLAEEGWRAVLPPRMPGGEPNLMHLSRGELGVMARREARRAARRNGVTPRALTVRLVSVRGWVPNRVSVRIDGRVSLPAGETAPVAVGATAEAVPAERPPAAPFASGGGYSGPLEIRQGERMRPDVARAFDRMAAAAARAGVPLAITSGFRSDAEQAALFAQNPDPRWVAPPGRSLHRCATELDLGPPSAYSWLGANAVRFGFLQRYSWEPWHYGFVRGHKPCAAAGDHVRGRGADRSSGDGLPEWVPPSYRGAILRSAARHGVSARLLAAQLSAESNFDPRAVSPAGAQGIAQFMPATARAVGLADPFDPDAAIDAQGRLMSELIGQLGSATLALAAYNAGPAAVGACGCVPPYPETRAYVAQIAALLDGGAAASSASVSRASVRLVR